MRRLILAGTGVIGLAVGIRWAIWTGSHPATKILMSVVALYMLVAVLRALAAKRPVRRAPAVRPRAASARGLWTAEMLRDAVVHSAASR